MAFFLAPGGKGGKNGTFEKNDITRKWCFQEVSELANRNGVLAYKFYFFHSCRNEESTNVTGKVNKN